jgi:hypothetical protein
MAAFGPALPPLVIPDTAVATAAKGEQPSGRAFEPRNCYPLLLLRCCSILPAACCPRIAPRSNLLTRRPCPIAAPLLPRLQAHRCGPPLAVDRCLLRCPHAPQTSSPCCSRRPTSWVSRELPAVSGFLPPPHGACLPAVSLCCLPAGRPAADACWVAAAAWGLIWDTAAQRAAVGKPSQPLPAWKSLPSTFHFLAQLQRTCSGLRAGAVC